MRFILIILMLLAPAGANAQNNGDTKNIDISDELATGIIATPKKRAEFYAKNEKWKELSAYSQKWVKDYPGDSDAWNYYGQSLDREGKTVDAVDAYSRAWELSNKKDFRIIENIGDSYSGIKEWGKALDAYHIAVNMRPRRAELREKLVNSINYNRHEGWQDDYISALKKLLTFQEFVNKLEYWRQYAEVLDIIDNDIEEQYQAYRHIIRLKRDDINAWERLYEIETTRENSQEAEKIVTTLWQLDRNNPMANLHYGKIELDKKNLKKATNYLQIALAGDDALDDVLRSKIYFELGRLSKSTPAALDYYKKSIRADIANIDAWKKAIIILRNTRRHKAAQKALKEMIEVKRKIAAQKALTPADAKTLLQ